VDGRNGHLATWTSPNGLVRAHYRTNVTAEDEFNRSFLGLASGDGMVSVPARDLGRFCIETFVVEIEIGKVSTAQAAGASEPSLDWERRPFSWKVLSELTGEHAADAWPSILALEIYQKVIGRHVENLDALKKTSLTASGPSTSGETPAATPLSPSST
jgi:hypothetical protein